MHADTKVDPARIQIVVATDCGSTTTKAILIEQRDGAYRQTHRGEAHRCASKECVSRVCDCASVLIDARAY